MLINIVTPKEIERVRAVDGGRISDRVDDGLLRGAFAHFLYQESVLTDTCLGYLVKIYTEFVAKTFAFVLNDA